MTENNGNRKVAILKNPHQGKKEKGCHQQSHDCSDVNSIRGEIDSHRKETGREKRIHSKITKIPRMSCRTCTRTHVGNRGDTKEQGKVHILCLQAPLGFNGQQQAQEEMTYRDKCAEKGREPCRGCNSRGVCVCVVVVVCRLDSLGFRPKFPPPVSRGV
jgi:hypothetical protein